MKRYILILTLLSYCLSIQAQCEITTANENGLIIKYTQEEQVYEKIGNNNNGDYRYGAMAIRVSVLKCYSTEVLAVDYPPKYELIITYRVIKKAVSKPRVLKLWSTSTKYFISLEAKEISTVKVVKGGGIYQANYDITEWIDAIHDNNLDTYRFIDTWSNEYTEYSEIYPKAISHLIKCLDK